MGHIHAAAMAEYAKDAAETDKPWERWEISFQNREYTPLEVHPLWYVCTKYRRKQKVILINGHEVPEPHRKPLEIDNPYWTLTSFIDGVSEYCWANDLDDNNALKNGFVHLTKEAAEKHFNALKSFTAKGDQ